MASRVVAIVQARMASTRLPGKVLKGIAGEPMIAHVVRRARRARLVDEVLVATTTDASDDSVAELCRARRIACVRGSQFDVLDRFHQAARAAGAEVVVRITADCPAIDPDLIDDAVGAVLRAPAEPGWPAGAAPGRFDFVGNRLPPPFHRTFPIGLDVEVCFFDVLERAWREGRELQHREHVMPFLYEGVQLTAVSPALSVGTSGRGFHIGLRNHEPDLGSHRWTVDTAEDLEFMQQAFERLGGRDDFSWTDLLALVERDPALAAINAAVQHKTLGDLDPRALKD